jgi:hypothetical protein
MERAASFARGRYVYMHDLPPRFNADILHGYGEMNGRWPDMCEQMSNAGLGMPLHEPEDDERVGKGALTGAGGCVTTPNLQ